MSEPVHIIWLASWYPTKLDPFPGDFIQRSAQALALHTPVHVLHVIKDAKGIVTKKVQVDTNVEGRLTETIVYYYPLKTGIKLVDKIASSIQFFLLSKKHLTAIKTSNKTICDVQVAMKAGILALWLKWKLNIPFCITEHWTGYYKTSTISKRSKAFWLLTKRIFKAADFFRPVTKKLGEKVNETICKIPFVAVPNVVNTAIFNFNASKKKNDVFRFVHVSTLGYQKNISGILNVVERLAVANKIPTFELSFIGPAPTDVEQYVNENRNLENIVHFSGLLPYLQVAEELKNADAMLMFSRYENLPCVMLEAFCCGLPVISSNVGGISERLDASNGILVESEDELGLEKAIVEMINNYSNYDCASISASAIATYNYETIGKNYLDNYKQFYPHLF